MKLLYIIESFCTLFDAANLPSRPADKEKWLATSISLYLCFIEI